MKLSSLSPFFFFFFFFYLQILLHLATCSQQQPLVNSPPILRPATLADADAISTVIIAASSPLPWWQYIYQFRHEYPEEHKRCVRSSVVKVLENANRYTEVIEAPAGRDMKIMAIATWRRGGIDEFQTKEGYEEVAEEKCNHQDMNITRAIDFERKLADAKRTFVDDVFGEDQWYLQLLDTHPRYQRQGAGTRLVNRGVQRGRSESVNLTLLAQPTAQGFYRHVGFEGYGDGGVGSVDGDTAFWFGVMAYRFQ